jgi:hypothetical protein
METYVSIKFRIARVAPPGYSDCRVYFKHDERPPRLAEFDEKWEESVTCGRCGSHIKGGRFGQNGLTFAPHKCRKGRRRGGGGASLPPFIIGRACPACRRNTALLTRAETAFKVKDTVVIPYIGGTYSEIRGNETTFREFPGTPLPPPCSLCPARDPSIPFTAGNATFWTERRAGGFYWEFTITHIASVDHRLPFLAVGWVFIWIPPWIAAVTSTRKMVVAAFPSVATTSRGGSLAFISPAPLKNAARRIPPPPPALLSAALQPAGPAPPPPTSAFIAVLSADITTLVKKRAYPVIVFVAEPPVICRILPPPHS